MGTFPRAELWNITTHSQIWVGTVDVLIDAGGSISGSITFPNDRHSHNNIITGKVNGKKIEFHRQLEGPHQGQIQTYNGTYMAHELAAAGVVSGVGSIDPNTNQPAKWSATIVVR